MCEVFVTVAWTVFPMFN